MKYIAYLALILMLFGCGQDDKLSRDLVTRYDSQFISKDCSKINSKKNIVSKKNALNAMKCFGLDRSLDLYEFVNGLTEEEFETISLGYSGGKGDLFSKKLGNLFLYNITTYQISEVNDLARNIFLVARKSNLFNNKTSDHIKMQKKSEYSRYLKKIIEENQFNLSLNDLRSMVISENSFFDKLILELKNKPFVFEALNFFRDFEGKKGSKSDIAGIVSYFRNNFSAVKTMERVLSNYQNKKLSCSNDDSLLLEFEVEFKAFLKTLSRKDQSLFADYYRSLLTKFTLYKKICHDDEQLEDFENILILISDLVRKPMGFNVLYSLGSIADFQIDGFQKILNSQILEEFIVYLEDMNEIQIDNLSNFLYEFSSLKMFNSKFESEALKELVRNGFFEKVVTLYEKLSNNSKGREQLLKELLSFELSNETTGLIREIFLINSKVIDIVLDFFLINDSVNKDLKVKVFSFMNSPILLGSYFDSNLLEDLSDFIRGVVSKENKEPRSILDFENSTHISGLSGSSSQCFEEFLDLFIKNPSFESLVYNTSSDCLAFEYKDIPLLMIGWNKQTEIEFSRFTNGSSFLRENGLVGHRLMKLYHSVIVNMSPSEETRNSFFEGVSTFLNLEEFFKSFETDIKLVSSSKEMKSLIEVGLEAFTKLNSFRFSKSMNLIMSHDEVQVDDFSNLIAVKDSNLKIKEDQILFSKWTSDILKPERRDDFLRELLVLLSEGETIYIGKKKKRKYESSLDSILKFLYYSTDEQYRKKVLVKEDGKTTTRELLLSQRLELLIKEISFADNYYGAYFMNRIAQTNKYAREVKKLKKYVNILNSSDGLLQKLGYFPSNSDERFFNIKNTYDSLAEISENKFGDGERIDGFVHALLHVVVGNSPMSTRKINPLKKPRKVNVEGHRGKLLALLSKKSMITKLGLLFRESCSDLQTCLKSKMVKNLKILIKNINVQKNITNISRLLKSSDEKVIKFYGYIAKENLNERKFFKSLGLLTEYELPGFLIDSVLQIDPASVKDTNVSLSFFDLSSLLQKISLFMKRVTPKEREDLAKVIIESERKISTNINANLFLTFSKLKKNAYSQLIPIKIKNAVSNYLTSTKLPYHYLSESFKSIYKEDGNFDYVFKLMNFIVSKNENNKSNLSIAINELQRKEKELKAFLLDHFTMFSPIKN